MKHKTRSKLLIYPETDMRFFYGFNPDVKIEFFKDENGKVTHFETLQNGKLLKAIKID